MASVNFQLRSTKINAPFSARVQFYDSNKISEGNPLGLSFIDGVTEILVFSESELESNPFINGKKWWTKNKKYKGSDAEILRRKNRILIEQDDLRKFILNKFDNESVDNFEPSKIWLKKVLKEYYNKKQNLDNGYNNEDNTSIIWHFKNYLKIKGSKLAVSTKKRLLNIENIISDFQAYQSQKKGFDVIYNLEDVSPLFQYDLEEYLRNECLYTHNTVAKVIKVLKTVCNYAEDSGFTLHKQYRLVELPYKETDIVYLSFEELQLIKNCNKIPSDLEDARDWLYLSCFMGQRISDFMRFNKDMIVEKEGNYTIDFIQVKTGKNISLVPHPEVLQYLKDNDFNFPKPISEQRYNEQIKIVCELAGITNEIEGSLLTEVSKGVWRTVQGKYPKYKLIGSHIGRASFSTNFYGLMPTSLIMGVTAHSQERTLLAYLSKKDDTRNELIRKYYNDINIKK
ncbi:phage integrase SAM-like domain-containing protein [Soonwooa sp.]|uniref:phage integrase SAM-like domain-containing protein n=1 Tax=Soonwooa sp. TaxID=1938592 RepID=UPI0028AF7A35|nr:phage integrase SAM-like domain-containing protein [Soonwooa sp.]